MSAQVQSLALGSAHAGTGRFLAQARRFPLIEPHEEYSVAEYIVVAEAQCRYKRPARFDDQLTIRTRVTGTKRRTIEFGYEVLNSATGELLATGETTHVVCDRLGSPKSLPEKYLKYFPANYHTAGAHKVHP